jgi:hypothetical protein
MEQTEAWIPPKPDILDTVPFSSDLKILLDDVDHELQALMSKQPDDEKRMAKIHIGFTPAVNDFQRLLSCTDCLLIPSRMIYLTNAR